MHEKTIINTFVRFGRVGQCSIHSIVHVTYIIAESLSARQLIVQYYLALRLYIYMYLSITVWNAIYYRGMACLARTEFPVTPHDASNGHCGECRLELELVRRCIAMCRSVVQPNLDILAQ